MKHLCGNPATTTYVWGKNGHGRIPMCPDHFAKTSAARRLPGGSPLVTDTLRPGECSCGVQIGSEPIEIPLSNELGTVPVPGACCELARRRSCVCVESTSCPVHGDQCRGSHD